MLPLFKETSQHLIKKLERVGLRWGAGVRQPNLKVPNFGFQQSVGASHQSLTFVSQNSPKSIKIGVPPIVCLRFGKHESLLDVFPLQFKHTDEIRFIFFPIFAIVLNYETTPYESD